MRSNQRVALLLALLGIASLLVFNFISSASIQGRKDTRAKASTTNKKAGEPRQAAEQTIKNSKKTEEELRATDPDDDADDPDLPPGMAGRIDKEEYLRARGDYIDLRRGRTGEVSGDARDKAIQQLEKQEAQLRDRVNRGQASPVDITNWTFLGPAPIPLGQTSTTRVPVSGRTIAIAVHPTNPDIVYVGTAQGGLYKSINGGTNWTRLFDFQLESLAIGAVTIDPVDSNIVYVGTGEPNLSADSFAGKGLYIIRNANSATPILTGPFRLDDTNNNVLNRRAIGRIVVNPANNNIIFVCTTSGVGGNPNAGLINLPPQGIYRSTNAQSANPTFSQVQIAGLGVQNRATVDLALDSANPNLLLATV